MRFVYSNMEVWWSQEYFGGILYWRASFVPKYTHFDFILTCNTCPKVPQKWDATNYLVIQSTSTTKRKCNICLKFYNFDRFWFREGNKPHSPENSYPEDQEICFTYVDCIFECKCCPKVQQNWDATNYNLFNMFRFYIEVQHTKAYLHLGRVLG